ncbi:MAG: hypothetical protein WDZ79_00870 [Candidatus Paceibacterota bacterium]
MGAHFFLVDYAVWHYTRAIRDGVRITRTLVWFCFHFFSIALLARTLFAPFEKLSERYPRGFDPSRILSALIVNTLMRLIGALARLVVIAIGLASMAAIILLGAIGFVVWIVFPLVTLGTGVTGILLLIGI